MQDGEGTPSTLKLSAPAEKILADLWANYLKTSHISSGRLFRLFDDKLFYAKELGLTTEEFDQGIDELYGLNIAYEYSPNRQTRGKWKYALKKDYAEKRMAALPTSTTTTASTREPSKNLSHMDHVSTTEGVRRGLGEPFGYRGETSALPPVSWIQGVVFYPPVRAHGFRLYGMGSLDEASTNHLRNICNVKGNDDQPWSLHLTHGKLLISKYGRLRLYPDVNRYGQDAIGLVSEEIMELLKRRDMKVNYELEGEFGYRVSGSRLEELKKGRCRLTWRNYSVEVYFDESVGKVLEGEHMVRIENKGDPKASQEISQSLADPFYLACRLDQIFTDKKRRSIRRRLTHLRKLQGLWVKYPCNGYRYAALSEEKTDLQREYWKADPREVEAEIREIEECLQGLKPLLHKTRRPRLD